MDVVPTQESDNKLDQRRELEQREAVNAVIAAILDRHGVPERRRKAVLESVLGMEHHVIGRRLRNEVPWSVQDISRLATHFGEPVYSIVGALIDGAGSPATLRLGGLTLPCSVWLGDEVDAAIGRHGPFLATRAMPSEQWVVLPAADVSGRAHEVRRVIFEAHPSRRVAVVDDDDQLTATIVDFLRRKGLEAVPYRSAEHVRTAIETSTFDGFILDWMLEHGNSKELLAAIRSRNPASPIIVLTGQLESGGAQEGELANAIAMYRAQLYEKPTGLLSLLNALQLGFDSVPRGSA